MTDVTVNNPLYGDGAEEIDASTPDMPPNAPNISQPANLQDPNLTAITNSPIPAPQQGQPSMWKNVLMGALVGLAGSAGARGRQSFGSGLGEGAQAELNYNQQQKLNAQRQQQIDLQKQQVAQEQQRTMDSHQLAQAQLGHAAINQQILTAQYNTMPKSSQDILDQMSMKQGADLRAAGNSAVFTGSHEDAVARQQAEMTQKSDAALSVIVAKNADGSWSVYDIANPDKLNTKPVDVVIGYDFNTNKPKTQTFAPGTISYAQQRNLETTAAVHISDANNQLEEYRKKSAIDQNREIAVVKAKAQADTKPVYAVRRNADGTNETVQTTMAAAQSAGMTAIRPVKETDIRADQHDIKVLNDIQIKSDNVQSAAGAMDQKSWAQAGIAAKILADNPNTTINNLFKSGALKNATPQTKAYVIAVNSLRESSMGLQKVLTGTARTNLTQLEALLNTLPGVEPDSTTVGQKLQAFNQNLGMLSEGLPSGTGVDLKVHKGSAPIYASAPGKPRLMSLDGGKSWQAAQ
jgi:hypothetical protein